MIQVMAFLILVALSTVPEAVASPAGDGVGDEAAAGSISPVDALGAIHGTVSFPSSRRRRVADRYAGGGAGPAQRIQEIPAVAFLQGPISGHPFPPFPQAPEMAQQDTAFVPSVLVIPTGTTVRFPNMDPFFHNVFSYSSPQRFDLGRYPQGEVKEVRFEEAGIVKVYCEVHESMRSAILILENPFHALVGEDGQFQITGVPQGDYTLVVWHADHGMVEAPVSVPETGAVSVSLEFS